MAKLHALTELSNIDQWVTWTAVPRDNGKTDKVPFSPAGPAAKPNDPVTWGSYDAALAAVELHGRTGVGFMFSPDDPYTGIDLDDCMVDGQLTAEAQAIVERLNSYTEVSPSGGGVKIWIRGAKPGNRSRRGPYECYDRGRFFTFTGQHLDGTPETINAAQAALDWFYTTYLEPQAQKAAKAAPESPAKRETAPDDTELIQKAQAARNGAAFISLWNGDTAGYPSQSEADQALANMLAFWTDRDPQRIDRLFRQSGLMRDKWDRPTAGSTYGRLTIDRAIADTPEGYRPAAETIPLKQSTNVETATKGKTITTGKAAKTDDYLAGLAAAGFAFRLNELDDSIEINGQRIDDIQRAEVQMAMHDAGFTGMGRIDFACAVAANRNRYHPVLEYFGSVEWDGRDHIAELLAHIHFASGHEWIGARYIRRWLVGAVAKAYTADPHAMLVIDGRQGGGKSYLVRWLCPLPRLFVEGPIQPDVKDSRLRLATKFVWEVSELQSTTRRADREALKAFITTREVHDRPPYGHYDILKPALASFIGTINETGGGFLNDPTGERRFNVCRVDAINWSYTTAVNRSQLWAQAVALFHNGETGDLTPDEIAARDDINSGYKDVSLVEELLAERYEIVDADLWVPVTKIVQDLRYNGDVRGSDKAVQMAIAAYMTQHGVEKSKAAATTGHGRVTCYRGVKRVADI